MDPCVARETLERKTALRDCRLFLLADGTGIVSEDMHVASLRNPSFGFAHVTTARGIMRELEGEQDGRDPSRHGEGHARPAVAPGPGEGP